MAERSVEFVGYHIAGPNPHRESQLLVVGDDPWKPGADDYTEAWATWPGDSTTRYGPWQVADVVAPGNSGVASAFAARVHVFADMSAAPPDRGAAEITLCDPGTYDRRYLLFQTAKADPDDLTFDDFCQTPAGESVPWPTRSRTPHSPATSPRTPSGEPSSQERSAPRERAATRTGARLGRR